LDVTYKDHLLQLFDHFRAEKSSCRDWTSWFLHQLMSILEQSSRAMWILLTAATGIILRMSPYGKGTAVKEISLVLL